MSALNLHPLAQLLADRNLGDMIELLVAAVIIIVSMLGGVLSKVAQRYQQKKEEDEAPPPARRPSPARRPTSRERPDRVPRPVRPPQPRPARPVAPARPAVRVETPPARRQQGPVYRTTPTRGPAVARRPTVRVEPVVATESTEPETLGTLAAARPTEKPRRRPHKPVEHIVGQITLPQKRLREAVIFRELIDRPVGLRDDQLWWPHSYR